MRKTLKIPKQIEKLKKRNTNTTGKDLDLSFNTFSWNNGTTFVC